MSLIYRDTYEFVPVDVDKGLDRQTGKMVKADSQAPKGYTQLPKCKFCKNYSESEPLLGTCGASMSEPKFMAYGDMIATTCGMFTNS